MLLRTPLILATIACAGAAFAIDDHKPAPAPAHNPAPATETRREGPVTITTTKPVATKPAATKPADTKPETKPEPKNEKGEKTEPKAKPGTNPADEPSASLTSSKAEPATNTGSKPEHGGATAAAHSEAPAITADEAIRQLVEGNNRWVSGKMKNPNTEAALRAELAEAGQHPFATILTCSDSRLPVERVFDRGVGEIFAVRVAGSVAGTSETGTVEYGLGHLKTPVLVVMAHSKCGAVKAALANAPVHGALKGLIDRVQPAVERARRNNPGAADDALLAAAIRENVWQTVFDLYRNSPEIRDMAVKGQVKVVGAVCDIATGKVEFLGEHPWQRELIAAMEAQPRTAAAPTGE